MQKLTDVIAKLTVKESVTKEHKDFAIDAIISMVVDDLAS